MIDKIRSILSPKLPAAVFTFAGALITGWPLMSARWYMTYLIGLVLVWTLPLSKKYQVYGYAALVLGCIAKGYFLYLTPFIEVESIPIPMYKGNFIQYHPNISGKFEELFLKEFDKDIDLFKRDPQIFEKNGKDFEGYIKDKKISLKKQTFEPVVFDFKILQPWLDHSKTWMIPNEVRSTFGEMPMVLKLHIKKAHHGTLWPVGTIFEEKPDGTIITHPKVYNLGFFCNHYVGTTFYVPYVKNVKDSNGNFLNQNWVYIEVAAWSVYLPLILLVASLLLCDLSAFPNNATRTIEQLICLSFAFFTICISDIDPVWNDCSAAFENLFNLTHLIHNVSLKYLAYSSPLWYFLNKAVYPIAHFGYLFPILCFWIAAWGFLQLVRLFFTAQQSYIIWALLIATPWFARQGIGLHVYRPLYISYNSLILGMPLFLIGLLGYFRTFTLFHGVLWIMTCLCSPVTASAILALFLHKNTGKSRFWYMGIIGILLLACYIFEWSYAMDYKSHGQGFGFLCDPLDQENVTSGPLCNWIFSIPEKGIFNIFFYKYFNFLTTAYKPFFILCALIPNLLLAYSKNALHKSIAWVALIMHGAFLFDGKSTHDVYLACTLSAVCATIYLFPYYERLLNGYRKLAANS